MKNLFLVVLILSFGLKGFAQCIAVTNNPTGVFTGPNLANTLTVNTCAKPGNYFRIRLAYGVYTVSSSLSSDFLTLTDQSNNVIFNNINGQALWLPTDQVYRVHIFKNGNCETDAACRSIKVHNSANLFPPSVSTFSVTGITNSTATCNGLLSSNGSCVSSPQRGFCYSTSPNPTIAGPRTIAANTQNFSSGLAGLAQGVQYYVRAFASGTSANGFPLVGYGSEVTFTTTGVPIPGCAGTRKRPNTTLINGPAQNGQTIVVTDGVNDCNFSGDFFYMDLSAGTYTLSSTNPTDFFTVALSGNLFSGPQPLIFSLNGTSNYKISVHSNSQCLSDNSCRGVSITRNGASSTPPTVSSTPAGSITGNSASAGGNVTAAGSSPVLSRGVCYSTTLNPNTSDLKTIASSGGTGPFTVNLTGLASSTQYHMRAYATSLSGTSYGADLTFTTLAQALPSLTTTAANSISFTSASCGGTVVSIGNSPVTSRGICYSTFANPTIANSTVTSGSGLGPFQANLSGLTSGTVYYIRAFATNASGTAYGNEISFTTLTPIFPTVTTSSVSQITATTATSGGNISNEGTSSIISRGVCFALTPNPTIANTNILSGTGPGTFISDLSGLSPNTSYYLRAFATNAEGTAYGSEISFTTAVLNSTNERESKNAIQIFPNPFKKGFNVKVPSSHYHSKFTLLSHLGSVVATGYLNGEASHLNFDYLPGNIYFLLVEGLPGFKILKE